MYSEVTNAFHERGTYLDGAEDAMNNMVVSAGNYLSAARTSAVSRAAPALSDPLMSQIKEAAKASAKGMFGKLM